MAVNQRLLQLESALQKAHALGNTEHARVFAEEIQRLRQAQGDTPAPSYQQTGVGNYQTETYKQSLVDSPVVPATPEEVEAYNKSQEQSGFFENLGASFGSTTATMSGAAPVISAGAQQALLTPGEYTGYVEDMDAQGNRILVPQTREEYDRTVGALQQQTQALEQQKARAITENMPGIIEAQRKAQEVASRDNGSWVSQLGADIGGALPSQLPMLGAVAAGAVTGIATKNPVTAAAAAKTAQTLLATVPAMQAYSNAYIAHMQQYPDAPESEHQAYAAAQASVEFGSEVLLPGAGAASTVFKTVGKRVGTEVLSENISAIGGSGVDLAMAPELAPKSWMEQLEEQRRATVASLVMSGGIAPIGASQATADFNAAKNPPKNQPPVVEPTPTGDSAIDAGQAAAAAISQQASALGILSKPQVGPASDITTRRTTNLPMTWAPGVDLDTPQGEVSPINGVAEQQQGVQSPPVKPNLPMTWARGVDLETPQGAVSDTRTQATTGDTPIDSPIVQSTAEQVTALSDSLVSTETQRKAIQEKLTETMTRKERKALNEQATSLIAKENEIKLNLSTLQQVTPETKTPFTESPTILDVQPTTQPTVTDQLAAAKEQGQAQPQTGLVLPMTRAERVAQAKSTVTAPQTTQVVPTTGAATPQVTGQVAGQVTPAVAPQPTGDTFVNEETGEVERLIPANDPERIAVENAIDLSIKQGSTRANRNNVALAVDGLVRSGKDAREPMRTILLNSIRRNKSSGGVIGALKTMADAQRKTTHKLYDAPDGIDTVIASLENHPMLKDLKVEIIDSLDNQPENVRKIYEKRGNRVSGVYSGDNHTLYLSGSVTTGTLGGRFSTVVHELVHAATLRALNLSKEGKLKDKGLVKATQEFQTVYDQFLKRTRDFKDFNIPSYEREALQYARTDINEFLTMSLTSPEFRSATKNVKFWKPIMAAIRKVLRIPPTDQELFDNMIEKGLDLIETTRKSSEALQQEWADNNISTKPVADVTITQEAKEAKSAFQSSVSSATRGIASVALPNQGVGTGISDFPARLAGERLVNDRKMIGLINKGSGELESVPTDDRPALNDKMTKALRGEKQTLPEEAAKAVKMVREYLDDLSTQLLIELKAAYAGKPIPEGDLAKMKVIAKERGTYLARVYDIDFGKMKGNHLLDAYAAGKPTAIARVKPALEHLTSKVASLPQRIVEAKAEADRRNQDEPLSGKQKWTAKDVWEMVGDKSTIKSYYTDIIGSPAGKSQETMLTELEEAAKGVDPNKAKDIAMQIVADLVGASEHSKSGRTGTGSYNQGLRARDAAMKSRSDMPPWLKNLLGEVHDFISVSAITAARITDVTASVRLGNQLMEESPQLFSDTRPTGKDWVQVGGSSPNAPGLYGRVAGKWAPPEVAALLNASFNPNGEFELSLENLAKNPLGWTGTAVAKTATKITGWLKGSMIKWSPFPWIGNLGNFPIIPLSNGNINPVYLKEASEGMGYLLGTAYTKAKDLTPKQKPVAALIDEALRQGVVDPVMVRTDDEVRLAERERQAMVDAGPIGSRKQRISRGFSNFSNTVTEGVNFLETTPKLANFYYWLDVMAKTKKYKDLGLDRKKIGQMLADGTTTRQVRLLIREAAVRTSENNISYNKVPKIVKAVEKGLLGSFVNFYFESMRAPARSALNGLKDIKSEDPALRTAGFRSLLGGTTGMLMVPAIHTAWIKASLDTSVVIVGGLLSAVGDDEDEERRRDLETILRTSLAYSEGNSRSLTGVDENGNVWVTDTGRGDPHDTWHSMIKSNIDAAYMFANGEEEAAIEKVKDTFAGVFSNFLGGSLVGGLASDAATGRSRKLFFEEAFPETADHFEEYFGKGANNYVNLQTPGVAKGIIKWAGTPEDAPTAIKILNLFNAPLNKIDTLRGVGAVAGRLSGDRRDAMKDLVESVASVGRIENDRLTAAVDTYRGAYLETWKELRDQVEAAQAAFRLGGVQPRVYNPRIRQAILDVYSNNQVADSVMSGKFFIPPLSDEAFVRGIEDKKALIKDRANAEELLLRLKEREKFVRDYYKEIKVE